MSSSIRELIDRQKVFYEVSPYYVVDLEGPVNRPSNGKRVRAGFDVDLYASGAEGTLQLTAGDRQFQATLKSPEELAGEILPPPADGSDIAIIPFENSLVSRYPP